MRKPRSKACLLPLLCSALIALVLTCSGCLSTPPGDGGKDSQTPLPWNSPAAWEGQVIGLPY